MPERIPGMLLPNREVPKPTMEDVPKILRALENWDERLDEPMPGFNAEVKRVKQIAKDDACRKAKEALEAFKQEQKTEKLTTDEYWKQKDREAAAALHKMFASNRSKPKPVEREAKGIDPGYVYLLRCADTPHYKIGRTKQKPEARISAIQCACPLEIIALKVEKTGNMSSLEKYLHRINKKRHHKNEWYTFESDEEAERLFKEGIKEFKKWRKGE